MKYKENFIVLEEINVALAMNPSDISDQVSIKEAIKHKRLIFREKFSIGEKFEWNNKSFIITDYSQVYQGCTIQWTYFIDYFKSLNENLS